MKNNNPFIHIAITLVLFYLSTTMSIAQAIAGFGIIGGVNTSSFAYSSANYNQYKSQIFINEQFGLFGEYYITDFLSVRPGAYYVGRGVSLQQDNLKYMLASQNIEFTLPVILFLPGESSVKPFVYGAPVFGFCRGGIIGMADSQTEINANNHAAFGYGITAAAGIRAMISHNIYLSFEAGYHIGLSDTFSPSEKDGTAPSINMINYEIEGTRKNMAPEVLIGISYVFNKTKPEKKVKTPKEAKTKEEPTVNKQTQIANETSESVVKKEEEIKPVVKKEEPKDTQIKQDEIAVNEIKNVEETKSTESNLEIPKATKTGTVNYDGELASQFKVYSAKVKANNAVCEDSKGNLWFYNNDNFNQSNLAIFNGSGIKTYKKYNGARVKFISSIVEHKGKVMLGTQVGLMAVDNNSWKIYAQKDGLQNVVVNHLAPSSDGKLLVFSQMLFNRAISSFDNGSFDKFNTNGYNNKNVYTSTYDNDGNLWVGTTGGYLLKYDGKTWTDFGNKANIKNVRTIAFDSNGAMWITGLEGSFGKYENGKFTEFKHGSGYFNPVPSAAVSMGGLLIQTNIVAAFGMSFGIVPVVLYTGVGIAGGYIAPDHSSRVKLVLDDENNAWVLARKRGVIISNGQKYEKLETKLNSPNTKKVSDILIAKDGKVWMTDVKGMVHCYENNTWKTYKSKDGVPKKPVMIYEDAKGNIWVSGKGAISVLHRK